MIKKKKKKGCFQSEQILSECSGVFVFCVFVQFYTRYKSKLCQNIYPYLEGQDAADEEEDCKDQAHVVGGHDILFVWKCPRLEGKVRQEKMK